MATMPKLAWEESAAVLFSSIPALLIGRSGERKSHSLIHKKNISPAINSIPVTARLRKGTDLKSGPGPRTGPWLFLI